MNYTAAVITVSDKGFRGERIDTSGPAIGGILREKGWNVVYTAIVPDEREQIQAELVKCTDTLGVNLVLTTGGTGFSPRDITPEATLEVIERRTPGIPEAMRSESFRITPKGCLSRAEAGIRARTLIVNLPGSEKAARENLQAVLVPVEHGVEMLLGSGSADAVSGQRRRRTLSMARNSSGVDTEKSGLQITAQHWGSAGRGVSTSPRPSAKAVPPSTQ